MEKTGVNSPWFWSMIDNLFYRIMAHEDFENFSKANNIPVSPELIDFRNQWFNRKANDYAIRKEWKDVRNWFLKNGRQIYIKFLFQYPTNTVKIIKPGIFHAYLSKNSYPFSEGSLVFFRIPVFYIFSLIVFYLLYSSFLKRKIDRSFFLRLRLDSNQGQKSLKNNLNKRNAKKNLILESDSKKRVNHIFVFSLLLQVVSFFCICLFVIAGPFGGLRHQLIPLLIGIISLMGMSLSESQ